MPNLWTVLRTKLLDRMSALNLELMSASVGGDRRRRRQLAAERETIRDVLATNDWRRATTII